jgi:hypothetical protein
MSQADHVDHTSLRPGEQFIADVWAFAPKMCGHQQLGVGSSVTGLSEPREYEKITRAKN